jgi:hypothetical protein
VCRHARFQILEEVMDKMAELLEQRPDQQTPRIESLLVYHYPLAYEAFTDLYTR